MRKNRGKTLHVKELRGIHAGREIVILGNGPSLREMDFTKLDDPIFIGMNGSAVVANEGGIVEHYYVLSDHRFVKDRFKMDMLKENLGCTSTLVVRKELEPIVSAELGQPLVGVRSLGRDGFSHDLSRGFYFGCTTVMLGMQLADYIGGKRIYLCGMDLRYVSGQPRAYREKIVHSVDNFSCVQIHNVRLAFKSLASKGVSVFNCSEESLLRPYMPYYDLKK